MADEKAEADENLKGEDIERARALIAVLLAKLKRAAAARELERNIPARREALFRTDVLERALAILVEEQLAIDDQCATGNLAPARGPTDYERRCGGCFMVFEASSFRGVAVHKRAAGRRATRLRALIAAAEGRPRA